MKRTFEVFSKLLKSRGLLLAIGLGAVVLVTLSTVKWRPFAANSKPTDQGTHPALPVNQALAKVGEVSTFRPNWEAFDYIHDQYAAANYKVAFDRQERASTAEAQNAPTDPTVNQTSPEVSGGTRRFVDRQSIYDPFSRPIPLSRPQAGFGGAAQSQAGAAATDAQNRWRSQIGGTLSAQGIH